VALCLGALVGLERQIAQEESGGEKDFPGVRTFAFTSLLGALAVLLSQTLGEWLAVALFAASAMFLVLRYRYDASERGDPGYTTEIASLCTFAVGALAQSGQLLVATVITIVMVALLRLKRFLHQTAELLSPTDMEVLIRFLVITGIVLPLLPDQTYDPFGVLRPRNVWWMVVLISSLSFMGYVLMRVGAGSQSHRVTGLLGGLVSSTATTVAYARASRDAPSGRQYEELVVLAASMAFVRLAIVLTVVAPELVPRVGIILGVMFLVGLGLSALRHPSKEQPSEQPQYRNPLSMTAALGFAVVYAGVLVLAAWARESFETAGIYTVTAIAATVGADAPTLSLARLAVGGQIDLDSAARGIAVVAVMTTLGKAAAVAIVGRGPFVWRVVLTLVVMAAAGALVLLLM
jgi:uncharacterized membrane protein (DUF4010 family)